MHSKMDPYTIWTLGNYGIILKDLMGLYLMLPLMRIASTEKLTTKNR